MNEFEFIKNIKKKYGLERVGDDCAVLPKDGATDLVVTTDLLVEDVDFKLDWTTPEFLGHKALAVSLSDIAAMGAEPKWAMLSIGVPDAIWNSKFLDRFYEGWHELAAFHSVELVGGDVSKTAGKFVIDSIVGGEVPKGLAILRSGAKAGDSIYVTGPLGGSAAGLRLLNEGVRGDIPESDDRFPLLLKQLKPAPRLEFGKLLREGSFATAMIDISDGLSSDLSHISRASGVGATIHANELPFDGQLMNIAGTVDAMLDLALNGGEDFELLFTGDEEKISQSKIDDIFRIGEITANTGVVELIRDGNASLLAPGGFRHF
ncbi:MAG TPA: thiamine-phosphate kinase [Pyrinomonadaceae bacterium]|nr:thiamine-phosphate kinase [Pyrinomonadaceae bacterium]